VPLSKSQKGAIGQFAFLSTAIVTGRGEVEVYVPVADNEGRDGQVRRHLKPSPGISVQIKTVLTLSMLGAKSRHYLKLSFQLAANRIQADSRFWYFFGFYDPKELRLHDPSLLIPSDVFHKFGRARKSSGGKIWFTMEANLERTSRDRWTKYRVAPKDLGKRLLEIVDSSALTADVGAATAPAGAIWLGRKRTSSRRRLQRA